MLKKPHLELRVIRHITGENRMHPHRFVTVLGTDMVNPLLHLFGEKLGRPSFVILFDGIFKVLFTDDQYLLAFFCRESLVGHLGDDVPLAMVGAAGHLAEIAGHGIEYEVLHGCALVQSLFADVLGECVELFVVHLCMVLHLVIIGNSK